ncbi:DUF4956 domain-containing protein [Lacrimispora sp. 38-1]|uniref:DUF4956 domain-containing protein n=1 Tax=Lacrimispora sp. 38-1 TaxID=3125778 RepID=UPI003CE7D5E1
MLNTWFQSILTEETEVLFSPGSFLMCLTASLVLGLVIAGIYMYRNSYSRGFVVTIALLPAMVQMVILLVNGNLGTGVAVMGAFSLVRFRSVPGKAEEISSIFQAMAVGLATGMGYVGMAVLFVLIMGGVNILLASIKFGQQKKEAKVLKITIPESLDYTSVFDEVFTRYLKKWDLNQVKTTNMGSLYKLDYEVVLKNNEEEKKLIDDLRCRNGNLEIFLGRPLSNKEEL